MTDTAAPSETSALPDLDAGQVAAMREQWVAAGYEPAAFDAAAAGNPASATAPEATIAVLADLKTPTATQAEALEMAGALIASGVPRQIVEEALRQDGHSLPADDERTDEERHVDSMTTGTDPSEYQIDYCGRTEGDDIAEIAAFNGEATRWLSQLGFSSEIGPGVVERLLDAGKTLAALPPEGRELWFREQIAALEEMAGGPEGADQMLQLAGVALARGDKAFADALWESGAMHEAGVLMQLALQGQRLSLKGAAQA